MSGFELTKNTYSPREFTNLYTKYVRPISYATVLGWIERYRNSGGQSGINAMRETVSGYYRIPASEVERVLLEAGATKAQN